MRISECLEWTKYADRNRPIKGEMSSTQHDRLVWFKVISHVGLDRIPKFGKYNFSQKWGVVTPGFFFINEDEHLLKLASHVFMDPTTE